jgi:hypothetical protein
MQQKGFSYKYSKLDHTWENVKPPKNRINTEFLSLLCEKKDDQIVTMSLGIGKTVNQHIFFFPDLFFLSDNGQTYNMSTAPFIIFHELVY